MKKILSLFSVLGFGVSATSSVVSCELITEKTKEFVIDKNDFEMAIGEKETIKVTNFSDFKNFSVKTNNSSDLAKVSTVGSVVNVEALAMGSFEIIFSASNAKTSLSIWVKIVEPTHVVEFEYINKDKSVFLSGYYEAFIKITNYKELVNPDVFGQSQVIFDAKILSDGTVMVDPIRVGSGKINISSNYSMQLTVDIIVKGNPRLSENSPISMSKNSVRRIQIRDSFRWEGVVVEVTEGFEFVTAKFNSWAADYDDIQISSKGAGYSKITVTATYFYEPLIIEVTVT